MLLRAEGVCKDFGSESETVLSGASFKVATAEKVGIVGRSGSGKSTLARIVAGLEPADAGRVIFDGAVRAYGTATPQSASNPDASSEEGPLRSGRREVRRSWLSMQMVFQNPEASFSSHMNLGEAVWEGAAYHPSFAHAGRARRRALVADALEAVGLPASIASKRAFEVSGGQCQRAALARAIIGEPQLIICDEATSALDVTVQAKIMNLLEELHASRRMAFLFISHNLPLVANFCDRIYELRDGLLVEREDLFTGTEI